MRKELRRPKVPMTSETEETAMARASQNPDLRTDSRARLIPKKMKNLIVQQYMRTRVDLLREPNLGPKGLT